MGLVFEPKADVVELGGTNWEFRSAAYGEEGVGRSGCRKAAAIRRYGLDAELRRPFVSTLPKTSLETRLSVSERFHLAATLLSGALAVKS